MPSTLYANNAAGTMAATIGPSDTVILLGAGQGALFPAIAGGNWFYATLVHVTTGLIEIVKVTARAGDSLTVERGRDGTTAISFTIGSVVEMRLCRIMLQEIDYRPAMGVANGVATLDGTTKIPDAQIPAIIARAADVAATYVPLASKGAVNGVASLDAGGKIPDTQIPAAIARDAEVAAAYVPLAQKAAANGVATLDGTTKIPAAQIPDISATYLTKNNPVGTGNLTQGGAVTAVTTFASSTTSAILANSAAGTVFLRPNGNTATNQATLNSAGLLTVVNMTVTSDRRKKKLIKKETPRDLASGLVLKSWRLRSCNAPGRGVVAQDLLAVAPEYVHESNGVLGVDMAGLALETALGLAARVRHLEKATSQCSSTSKLSTTRSNSSVARRSKAKKSQRSSA